MSDSKEEHLLTVGLEEKIADGIYSNMSMISHSSSEFVYDFVRIYAGLNKADIKARVIQSPEMAKRFCFMLSDAIRKYEAQFGEIKLYNQKMSEEHQVSLKTKGEA